MFARRRPLLRAAVVGGAGYVAGKKRAQSQEAESGHGNGGGQPSAAEPPAESAEPSVSDQLAQLSNLHAQGALSDAEFASAKAKLLGS
jgi:hypothetical protein